MAERPITSSSKNCDGLPKYKKHPAVSLKGKRRGTVLLSLPPCLRELCKMLHGAGIPDDLLLQPFAGEFRAEAAELHPVTPGALVDGTAAGFLPFRDVPVRFDAPGASPLFVFPAPVAALPAGGDSCEIDLFHEQNSCDIRFCE